jgi:hypothetical protein
MRRVPLALIAASALASPAFAAQPLCRGEACGQVTPFPSQGCWAYHNASDKRVRGVISAPGEIVLFEIEPGGNATPRFKSGACLRDARPYQVDFNANRVEPSGRPRRGGGGR